MVVDYDYEESVRGIYRENATGTSAPVSGQAPVNAQAAYTRDDYTYERDADLYTLNDTENRNQPIRLYEERLVADKDAVKTGDVVVGKRVESETASVSIPVEKERVVIERSAPTTTTAGTTNHTFKEGEVARVEVYEEKANVRKEAVLSEEVTVRKEREQEMISRQETVRREELDVTADDDSVVLNK